MTNAYTAADPTISTKIIGSPFTVTCIEPGKEPVPDEPGKEPVPDEPKKSNETPTDLVPLLVNWFFDDSFLGILAISIVSLIYLYFTKKSDPPQADYKTKDGSSKDSLMIVVLEWITPLAAAQLHMQLE